MPDVKDALGRSFLAGGYLRIVSLVPSWTESLFRLGAGERVVGVTDYCVEPAAALEVRRVGGTKNPRLDDIVGLHPDLVVANIEENRRGDIERLQSAGIPAFVTDAHTVEQALVELRRLGELVGGANLKAVVEPIEEELKAQRARPAPRRPRVFIAIWRDPWMTVNGETFIGDMVRVCGGQNVFEERERRFPLSADVGSPGEERTVGGRDRRYPRVSVQEIVERAPDLILLPDEPFAFCERDAQEWRERVGLRARVELVDGKVLSWYGVRMGESMRRLKVLLDEGE